MSQGKLKKAESKSGRKKLSLSKETLKDLTAGHGGVKGGERNTPGIARRQRNTIWDGCSF